MMHPVGLKFKLKVVHENKNTTSLDTCKRSTLKGGLSVDTLKFVQTAPE